MGWLLCSATEAWLDECRRGKFSAQKVKIVFDLGRWCWSCCCCRCCTSANCQTFLTLMFPVWPSELKKPFLHSKLYKCFTNAFVSNDLNYSQIFLLKIAFKNSFAIQPDKVWKIKKTPPAKHFKVINFSTIWHREPSCLLIKANLKKQDSVIMDWSIKKVLF